MSILFFIDGPVPRPVERALFWPFLRKGLAEALPAPLRVAIPMIVFPLIWTIPPPEERQILVGTGILGPLVFMLLEGLHLRRLWRAFTAPFASGVHAFVEAERIVFPSLQLEAAWSNLHPLIAHEDLYLIPIAPGVLLPLHRSMVSAAADWSVLHQLLLQAAERRAA